MLYILTKKGLIKTNFLTPTLVLAYLDDMFLFKRDNKTYTVFTHESHFTIEGYDYVYLAGAKMIGVRKDRKIGFFNHTGNLVIPLLYDSYTSYYFKNKMVLVTKDKKYYMLDVTGKEYHID